MKKKILTFLIVAAMLSSSLVGCGGGSDSGTESSVQSVDGGVSVDPGYEYTYRDLAAPVYTEAASAFAGGSGTAADPYQISTAAELAYMGKMFSDSAYYGACYVLTADIALNDLSDFENWATKAPKYSWQPVGSLSKTGVFDGAGHTISGLYINTNCGEKGNYVAGKYGLFEQCAGTIKNLNIDKSYIAVSGNTSDVGAVAGVLLDTGKIENCTVNAVFDCYDNNCGGIAGNIIGGLSTSSDTASYSVITKCTFNGVINQKKQDAMSMIGGIAGSGDGNIDNCVNNGTVNFGANDLDSAGGIIGFWGDGVIENCENNGNLNGSFGKEGDQSRVGGIVGNLFVSATGSEQYMSRGATVKNCTNKGTVSGHYAAGGIVGNANNDMNNYCLTVSKCVNTGTVKSFEYTGGIIGRLYCSGNPVNGDNVVVEGCENKAPVDSGVTGGIISFFYCTKGKIAVRDCVNSGAVSTKAQNCAGIIAYWLMDSKADAQVAVENCKNNSSVHSAYNAGGIICYADAPVALTDVKGNKFTVNGCENNGEVATDADNAYIGGIIGAWGMKNMPTTITDCKNNGKLSILNASVSEDSLSSDKQITISRIAGGIIGRLGEGLLLTTDSDKASDDNIQKDGAVIKLSGCSNTGSLSVNCDEEYTDKNGNKIYVNYFGGIIGNTCGEEGFSVYVENSNYSNFDRGLGNSNLKDIGTKK